MGTDAPVLGLLPTRGGRWRRRKLPNRRNSTCSPAFRASVIHCKNSSTIVAVWCFGSCTVAATLSTRSAFVIRAPLLQAGPTTAGFPRVTQAPSVHLRGVHGTCHAGPDG